MEVLRIKTQNGSMAIYLDRFFPCTQKHFRELLKIIRQFSYLNDIQAITGQLKTGITDKLEYLECHSGQKKTDREISALKKCLGMLERLKV